MAQNDEILTRYALDMKQPFQEVDKFGNALVNLDKAGAKTFSDIGKQAQDAGRSIASSGQLVQRASTQYNSLGNSINQISRELPAFTMNLNTGFLAISNNLPALADAINQIKASNKDLAAQGKQTVSVLGALGSAIFSWQTLLSVGITLLTAYGGKLYEYLAGADAATKAAEEQAEAERKKNEQLEKELQTLEGLNRHRQELQRSQELINAARAGGLADQRRELELIRAQGDAEEIFLKEQSVRENELIELKNKANILEFADDLEKIKAAEDVKNKQNEITAARYRFEREQAEIAKKEAEKLAKEKAAFESELLEFARKNNIALNDQALDELTTLTDAYFKDKEAIKAANADEERQKNELLGEDTKRGYIRMKQLSDEAAAEIELNNVVTNAKLSNYSAIASILGAFGQIVGQSTEAGKALSIAEATIATYVSAVLAYKSQLTIPTPDAPIRAKLAATSAIVTGLASVAAILAVQVPKPTIASLPSSQKESTTLPKGYKDGVVDLQGPGTGTSDSITARLSKGESVIKATATSYLKDELEAANRSKFDYEAVQYQKRVKPAIDEERKKNSEFVDNIVRSVALNFMGNNKEVVKAINKNRPASAKDILKLTETIARQNRIDKFESKLKQTRK